MCKHRLGRPILSLALVATLCGAVSAQMVLIYDNNSTFQTAINAVTNLGFPFTRAMSGDFVMQLTGGTAWDIVVLDLPSNEPAGAWQTALETYIAGGGRVVHSMWNNTSLTPTLQAAFEITKSGTHQTVTFYRWNSHPLFSSPNMIDDTFDVWADVWGTNGFYVEPTGTAVAAAGFTATPQANQAAIVIGNSNRTIFNGFIFDDYDPADKDMDGKKDIIELVENEILFLLGPGCAITSPAGGAVVSGDIDVVFDASDPENDPVIATFEWSTDGGTVFNPCTTSVASLLANPTLPLVTPSSANMYTWDSITDGVGVAMIDSTIIRISVTDGTSNGGCSVQVDIDNLIPPPSCTITTPAGTSGSPISFDLTLTSPSAPMVDLVAEYSIDGGATYLPATADASSPLANPAVGVATGPAQFIWDSRGDGVATASVVPGALLRITVDDGFAILSGTCTTGPFDIDNQMLCNGICGDCNLSMLGPDILDALTAAQVAAGLLIPTPEQAACCDVNASMTVDVLDALFIAQDSAGLMVMLTCL